MSRIGKRPVAVPAGVTVNLKGNTIAVKGPKGELARTLHPEMAVAFADGQVSVTRPSDDTRHKALHGLTRTLVANMVEGVTTGYQKVLEMQGVGYKAEVKPFGLNLVVGLSAPGAVQGARGDQDHGREQHGGADRRAPNKELVGQVAAEIRSVRPPEPYKGKGIRYQGEQVRRKAGKTGAK